MKRQLLLGLAGALVAAVIGIALLRHEAPQPTAFIYLLDARPDMSKPLDADPLIIRHLERKYSAKVIVRAADSLRQLRDYSAIYQEFGRTRDAIDPQPIFFALNRPYSNARKLLRSTIDGSALVNGESRIQLLGRLVAIRDTERLGQHGECVQLKDDVTYMTDNFSGIGLLVHDGSLQELKNCMQDLVPEK